MKRIPLADDFIEVERHGGLHLALPRSLTERGQRLAFAVVFHFVWRRSRDHPHSSFPLVWSVSDDTIDISRLDPAEANLALTDLLVVIRAPGSLQLHEIERAA
jgi:hypothetical protein